MSMRFVSRLAALLLAAAVIGFAATSLHAGGPATHTESDVLDSDELTVMGVSKLVRTDSGVSAVLKTAGLEPGAYTCWFIVFNHPEECVFFDELGPGSCGLHPDDFAVGGPAGFGFTRATGHIVGESGEATFAGHLKEGAPLLNDALDLDEVFEDARTAEIQLLVRYHGPKVPGMVFEQTHTLQPELGIGPDVDVQFSVHAAP
jgi:hypothetical protein